VARTRQWVRHENERKAAINARRRELYAQMVESDPERHAARKAQMQEHAQAMPPMRSSHERPHTQARPFESLWLAKQ